MGPKTACKWLEQYGSLEGVLAHAGRDRRRCRREPAQGGRLAAQGARAPHDQARRRAARCRCKRSTEGKPDTRSSRKLSSASSSRRWLRELGDAPSRERRRRCRGRAPRRNVQRRATTDRSHRRAAEGPGCLRLEARELVGFDTETTWAIEPMTARAGRDCRSPSSGERGLHPARPPLRGRPSSSARACAARALKPWLEDADARRSAQNVKYDMHVLANHGITLAGVRARHAAPVVRARRATSATTWTTSPSATAAGADELRRGDRQGRRAHPVRAGRGRARDRVRRRGRRRDAAAARRAVPAGSRRDEKLRRIYREIEMPVLQVLFAHGAQRRAARHGDASRSQSRELGKKMLEIEQRAHEAAGQPFNLDSPEADPGDPVRQPSCRSSRRRRRARLRPTRTCSRSSRSTIRCRS